ncbi:DNA polymerase alpha accessory factor Mcl1, partial [Coemansia sp. RSA 2708]
MPHTVTPPRYAHAEGFTAVAFGQGGDFICTGGSDSLLRVFYSSKVERDQEAITLEQHSDNVLSLAVSRSKIVSGDEEGVVLCFDVSTSARDEGGKLAVEPSGTVLRSTLPARDISISGSERQVAVATDDEKLVVVSLLDTSVLHTLDGHRGSVNSVSYSPDSTYLASTGCNGTVRVWDMRGDEPSCVSVLHKAGYVCEPGSSMDQSKARWSPDGRFIAVPGSGHTIKLVERGTWQIATELGGVHSKMVSHVAWSSNSKYLASVGLDGHVVVWDVTARASILTHAVSGSLCQVDWNPCGNMLAFTDGAGAMYIWDDVIPLDQGHAPPYERHPVARGTAAGPADDGTTSTLLGGLFDDNADEDTGPGAEIDDDDGGDDDIDDGEALDDFVVDDDHGGYAEHHVPRWTASDAQAHAFQPGSTPWIDGRRYLALNMVGSVAAVAQDSYNTIEIEFHDKSLHRDMHFSDSFRFSLAALADA